MAALWTHETYSTLQANAVCCVLSRQLILYTVLTTALSYTVLITPSAQDSRVALHQPAAATNSRGWRSATCLVDDAHRARIMEGVRKWRKGSVEGSPSGVWIDCSVMGNFVFV